MDEIVSKAILGNNSPGLVFSAKYVPGTAAAPTPISALTKGSPSFNPGGPVNFAGTALPPTSGTALGIAMSFAPSLAALPVAPKTPVIKFLVARPPV